MNAYSEIMDAARLIPVMNIPIEMRDSRVEVIVLPIKTSTPLAKPAESMMGYLKQYANTALAAQEKVDSKLYSDEL